MRWMLAPALALFLLGGIGSAVSAQQPDKEELDKRYEEKLAKEFVKKVPWVRSLEEAEKQAAESSELILGYFSRSYSP